MGSAMYCCLLSVRCAERSVIATCRDPGSAQWLHQLREDHPDRLSIVQLDATDEDSISVRLAGPSCPCNPFSPMTKFRLGGTWTIQWHIQLACWPLMGNVIWRTLSPPSSQATG